MRCLLLTVAAFFLLVVPTSASVRGTILAEAQRAHLNSADTQALITLAFRESSFRPTARNGVCLGLFQLGPAVRARAARDPRWRWYNPAHNIWTAIGYIHSRYGSPRNALRHSYNYGWY